MAISFGKDDSVNFTIRTILSYFLFILLVVVLNHNNANRLSSFLIVVTSACVALTPLFFGLKSKIGFNPIFWTFWVFFFKLFIGFLFWRFYMFPDYFGDNGSVMKFDHFEYLLTEDWMHQLAEERLEEGLFYHPPQLLIMLPHYAIHYFMSNLYLSGSYNPFDLSVQNTLFSVYTAFIVLAIGKHFKLSAVKLKSIFIIALLQPFSLISSIIWRDTVGQFFVAFGGYLTVLAVSKKNIQSIFLMTVASFSMILQRHVYFFFPLFAFVLNTVLSGKNKYRLLIIPFLLFGIVYLNDFLGIVEFLDQGYGENITGARLWLLLPLNILRVFIGPFPWTQWLQFDDNTIFQIADYLQTVVVITLLFMILKKLLMKGVVLEWSQKNYLLLLYLFIPFIFVTLGTPDIHQGYMTIGTIFLIPIAMESNSILIFMRNSIICFSIFIIMNFLYLIAGLSGSGVGGSFR